MPQDEFIIDRTLKHAPCPTCGKPGPRHSIRVMHPQDLHHGRILMHISRHVCKNPACPDQRRYFTPYIQGIMKGNHYTSAVKAKALDLLKENTLKRTSEILQRDFNVCVPPNTLYDWKADAPIDEGNDGSRREE